MCLGGCSGGLGSAGTREEQEGSGHGLADWETREGRRSSSSCLVLWGVWGAGPGRLGSRIYGAGHPRPWGLELARGCQGLCLTELPLQNPHRRQTLQVPTSWLRKGFHSALQPPGECLPACLLPAWCKAARPLQRERRRGWGWGSPTRLLTPAVLPTVSPAPAQQGQALQVSQLLPGLLGLRLPADPPVGPRHQARQGLLLQHVRAGLHLGECLGPCGASSSPGPQPHQICIESPHSPDKETEAQRGEVTPQDHDEWPSQGFGFPVLFLAALGRAPSLLAAFSLAFPGVVSSRPSNTQGSAPALSRAREAERPLHWGSCNPHLGHKGAQ